VVNWPLWLGAGLLSCAILGAAGGFTYWRRTRLAAREVAPEVPQVLEPVPAELRPLIENLALPFATAGIEDADPHPSVLLDRKAIYVGLKQVGNVEPLQQSGHLQRVDELFNTLKAQRESWKAAHSGQEFDGVVDFWIDENASLLIVKDVVLTAAFAGFPNGRFATRSRNKPLRIVMVPVGARVPGPPGRADPQRPTRVLAARLRPDDLVELAWVGEGLQTLERSVPLKDVAVAIHALWGSRPPVAPQADGPKLEQAIVFVPNEAPFCKLVQVLDGLYELRLPPSPGSSEQHPAFAATLRPTSPDQSAKELANEYLSDPSPPRISLGATTVRGRLEPETIQATVRQGFAGMRSCYDQGLDKNPKLRGQVSVRFVIKEDGKVGRAEASPDSTLTDVAVRTCIVRVFESLQFPPPEGGIVNVAYPITLTPG
jgi:hypothetical protein